MARPSKSERTWSDAQLKDAVAASSNWRHVMRALGLNANSAGAVRIVRRHAERLGLDTSHFRTIAGRVSILLHSYTRYIVGSAAGLMTPRPAVA